jgi:hybrid cluster-associated redox disulfide protein
MKITKKTNMNELLMEKPELAGVLFHMGMGCMGCPMAQMETIEEGMKAHDMTDKQIDKLVEKLNKMSEAKKVKKK